MELLFCTDMTTSGLSYVEVKVWSISFSICHQDGVKYLGIEIGLGHVLTMLWSVCTRWLDHCSRSLVITVVSTTLWFTVRAVSLSPMLRNTVFIVALLG